MAEFTQTPVAAATEVADVGPGNTRAMDYYVRRRFGAEKLAALYAHLPAGWTPERLQTEWAPLSVYQTLEKNLIGLLGGRPDQLFTAGLAAGFASRFGKVPQFLADLLLFGLRFFFSPELMLAFLVPETIRSFNQNKLVETLAHSTGSVTHRTTYRWRPGTHERLREPIEDYLSLLWWAPGMVASSVRFWWMTPRVRHAVVELDLPELLADLKRRGWSTEARQRRGHDYLVGETIVAEPVRLGREPDAPYFTVTVTDQTDRPTKPGWRLTRDLFVTNRAGTRWLLARRGTIFAAGAGCTITRYDLSIPLLFWPVFHLFSWLVKLPWIAAPMRAFILSRAAEMHSQTLVNQLESAEAVRRLASRFRYPTAIMQARAEGGEAQRLWIEEPVILAIDTVGSTSLIEMSRGEGIWHQAAHELYSALFDLMLPYEHGRTGAGADGDALAVMVIDVTGDGAILMVTGKSRDARLVAGLALAADLHARVRKIRIPEGRKLKLRIGMACDSDVLLWSTPQAPCLIMASGRALHRATRFEQAGKLPGLSQLAEITLLPAELADGVADRWQFEDVPSGRDMRLPGIDTPVTLVAARGPSVRQSQKF